MSFSALLSHSLHLVWPAACAACGCEVPEGVAFCGACNLSINPLDGVCTGCALPVMTALEPMAAAAQMERPRCPRCRRVPFPFRGARAGFEYGEALAEAIMRMKHGGRRELGAPLGRLLAPTMAEVLAEGDFGGGDLIVPVPLHTRRLRMRGFNQAVELARHALTALSRAPAMRPAAGLPRLERSLLHRTRATRELGRASPAARFAEVAGAFDVSRPDRVRDRRVLLVDDVLTTGATATACADALSRAGATQVYVLALARAV